jgi:hypothetical protein
MLYFNSLEDCNSELNKVLNMSMQDREKWQMENGFKSLGVESDKFYASIESEKFVSIEDIKKFVEKNSIYLQLNEDENGEYELDVRLCHSPFRFLANKDGLFQVNNKICKVFEKSIVSVDENKIEELKEADFETALDIDGNSIEFTLNDSKKSIQSNCQPAYFRSDVGGERIRLYIGTWVGLSSPFFACGHFEARPYNRVLGIWFYAQRDVSCDINIGLSYLNVSKVWTNDIATYSSSQSDVYVIEKYIVVGYCTDPNYYADPYNLATLLSFDSWAQQENTNKAIAFCE